MSKYLAGSSIKDYKLFFAHSLKWYDSEGEVTYEQSIPVSTYPAYRIWRRASDVKVGKNEVRLYSRPYTE